MPIITGAIPRDAVRTTVVAGGSAGNHTVAGIKARDKLVSVIHMDFTDASETAVDRTAEFSVSADNVISNVGGTDTTGGFLLVTYLSVA